ncbi:M20/M25/M40 family metallo-hydrolase [Flavobacterium sp. F372]|jgi:acetylornithine deacetylase/succinyl-diaminopimelate desuccinylase-like protein|uniref:M20/M25/M40 family metallo-hydrolase n=1 Tax=Flavobacterium bernardetii TaxID=2813823 RepID=A0ABR7IU34_9FLAO|nr:M28 family peptidase [Flavobacterium bernardetii]MBC5833276.1 M20/M25/M40 family metallo-hydrolase [Flavobacterium bernardetii]NHF68508.1 M20/M25/M40 family metallo-hydrolase [Flavobacterium bernardetii]
MNKISLIAFGLLIASCGPAKMIPTPDVISEVQENKSKEVIAFAQEANVSKTLKYLTSDELEGRDSGSKGIEKASIYLENLLKENGIKPYFKTYRDTLSNFEKTSYNIVGYIEGTDPVLKNEFVIIGAHYDHIGKISAVNGDDIANGANDNAAGTTSVSEVAKYFAKAKSNKRSLLFVFFSAEEKGLLGSKHLAAKLKQQNMNLYFMFNYEMVGVPMQNRDMLMYITGFGKSNMAAKMNEYSGDKLVGYIPAETKYMLFRASDNFPFYDEFNVPAQTVSTFDFENFDFYHQPDDEFELMNTAHITTVVNKTIPVLEKMMNAPTKEIKLNAK